MIALDLLGLRLLLLLLLLHLGRSIALTGDPPTLSFAGS